MSDRWFIVLQYLLPKRWLTQCLGALARAQGGAMTHGVIRWFIQRYGVDMSEAQQAEPAAYKTFNDFFTRALRPGVRPLAHATWISPVDGAISQLGPIAQGQIFQAKGHQYSVQALLGRQDTALAQRFHGGQFATLYLSPRDYHRIHMPCDGQLRRMTHVPGDLFSVNPTTAAHVPGLFARNERVVCEFDTPHGPLVMVLVGATVVGSMATVWHGVVTPPRSAEVRTWSYGSSAVNLKQGDEMGRFLLGSTVVLLWPEDAVKTVEGQLSFEPSWQPAQPIRMGQAMAAYRADRSA